MVAVDKSETCLSLISSKAFCERDGAVRAVMARLNTFYFKWSLLQQRLLRLF
jgi:hypothetical protein